VREERVLLLHSIALTCSHMIWVISPRPSKIALRSYEDDGHGRGTRSQLSHPLLLDVLEGVTVIDGVAKQEHVCVCVTKWSESAVVVLTCWVPDLECQSSIVNVHLCAVAVQDCWHVLLWELVIDVANEDEKITHTIWWGRFCRRHHHLWQPSWLLWTCWLRRYPPFFIIIIFI